MSSEHTVVKLKKGRENPVMHGHPWVFSGAIEEVRGPCEVGTVVEVTAHNGTWLARGLAHPKAGLAVRLYTRDEAELIDSALFARRITQAIALRSAVLSEDASGKTNAYRLVFSEADGLSGLIVDRYAGTLVLHVGARVLLPYLQDIVQHLVAETGHELVHVVADRDAVEREGLPAEDVSACSTAPVQPVEILQDGYRFEVDPAGQKTGFFLDQRINRRRVAAYAKGRSVLSAYCYTGAFEVYTAAAGASSITGIDTSPTVLTHAEKHIELNGLETPREYVRGDVTKILRTYRDAARSFGMIVLDPPRFVANRNQLQKGLRAYKDVNLWALKLLESKGILATFSCSGLVSEAEFGETIRWAAADAGRDIRVLEVLGQPPDHPVNPFIPENRYLKGLICWVD